MNTPVPAFRSKKQKKTESFTDTIERISHDGRGIAVVNEKTTFVFNALPGETATYKYSKCHSKFDEAYSIEIANPSPDRIKAACPHFGRCGGCQLQHMTTDHQLQLKEKRVKEQMLHAAEASITELMPAITGSAYGYRRKARLSIKYIHKMEKTVIGFREQNGRYVTDSSGCQVLDPAISQHFQSTAQLINKLACCKKLPQIEAIAADNQVIFIFRILENLSQGDEDLLREFAQQTGIVVYVHPNKPMTLFKVYPDKPVAEPHYICDDLTMTFTPDAFIQVNAAVNKKMVAQMIDWLQPHKEQKILDLYCGIGNLSLPLAKRCHSVVGIEGCAPAVERAIHNARLNHIDNATFWQADLSQKTLIANWAKQQYDIVVLDPARSGAEECMELLGKWQPEKVLYISCNTATLARDSKRLIEQGYALQKLGLLDMFPQTGHVEAMGLFVKG